MLACHEFVNEKFKAFDKTIAKNNDINEKITYGRIFIIYAPLCVDDNYFY